MKKLLLSLVLVMGVASVHAGFGDRVSQSPSKSGVAVIGAVAVHAGRAWFNK